VADAKVLHHNQLLLNRFISIFGDGLYWQFLHLFDYFLAIK